MSHTGTEGYEQRKERVAALLEQMKFDLATWPSIHEATVESIFWSEHVEESLEWIEQSMRKARAWKAK